MAALRQRSAKFRQSSGCLAARTRSPNPSPHGGGLQRFASRVWPRTSSPSLACRSPPMPVRNLKSTEYGDSANFWASNRLV